MERKRPFPFSAHRAALSNGRLVGLADGAVSFRWQDYAHGGQERVLTLAGEEFLRRWVQHVLPRGFVKVRHHGLLANGRRAEKLAACRRALLRSGLGTEEAAPAAAAGVEGVRPVSCPACGSAAWVKGAEVPRAGEARPAPDTS